MAENSFDGISEILIDNAPVNALSVAVRRYLIAAIEEAEADPAVKVILLRGAARAFSAGADIAEFAAGPMEDPWLPEVVDRMEVCEKPVIAAISGLCLGGGLETAMACHYRVADGNAKFGLPEVALGILPGAGGTQRLPRLVGTGTALGIMTSGRMIDAKKALEIGLVDQVVDQDVLEVARELARSNPPAIRRTSALPLPADLADAVAGARAKLSPKALSKATARIIDCVEAMSEDFAKGRAVEAKMFDELMSTEAARGLRHAFFGERKVAQIPGLDASVRPRSIEKVGIIGGGLMGTGIGIALLNAGLTVIIVEPRDEARAKSQESAAKTIRRDVEKGRISEAKGQARIGALLMAASVDALSDVDLVIEAVFEELSVKKDVLTAAERVVRADTILASNTSTLNLDVIADFVADPSRVIGLHFFSPANIMRLLEIVRGAKTAPDVLATATAFARRIGKIGVVSGVCDGFIGNRMVEEYLRQAYLLLEEGALPQDIDGALERWGMAMGPIRVMDLAGQDIGWAIRKRRAVEQPDRPYSALPDRVCELGHFGQKVGKGMYLYPDGRNAVPDPEITQLIENYSKEIGLERRKIDDEEIVERCLLALVNEGAKIVGEGIAYRPVDVDMIYLNGYGFPRERGGPMFQADEMGLLQVLEKMRKLAEGREGWAWEPAPLLVELAAQGQRFADLNG